MEFSPPLPKYHQIYLVLREQLQEGVHDGGLPSELTLVRQFGVARVTIRRALQMLATEGLIKRAPGRGTTRIPPAVPRVNEAPVNSLLRHLVSMGCITSVKILEVCMATAPDPVASALELAPGSRTQKAVRVRSTRQGPVSLITTYLPESVALGIDAAALNAIPMLTLLERSGVALGEASQQISARLADALAAEQLQLPVGSALLSVTRVVRDTHRRPVQWLHGLYRPDRYHYELRLGGPRSLDAQIFVGQTATESFSVPMTHLANQETTP